MPTESQQVSAVKKQRERADKLWQEKYGKKMEPETAKPVGGEPPAEPPTEAAPPIPPPEPAKTEPEPVQSAEPSPAPAAPTPTPPKPPEADYKAMYEKSLEETKSLKSLLETEKQRFSTLQGKYNAEVPRMQFQLNTLMEEMGRIKERPTAEPKPQVAEPSSASKSLKADFPELYEGIKALIREESQSLIDPFNQKLKKMEEEKVVTAVSSYERDLTKEIPNWKVVNTDPEFTGWLMGYEPNGRTRHEMLLDAFQRRDVKGTAYYFNAFLESKKPPEPPTQQTPPEPQTVQPTEPNKAKPLAVPRGGSGGTPPTPPQETYTPADLVAHTKEKISGLWRGREDEWKKKETKITKYLIKARKG